MLDSADRPVHPIWSVPLAWPWAGGMSGSPVVPVPLVSKVLSLGIVAAIAAPWLVHLIPVSDASLGPIWLPIFYAPMLAALMLRLPVAVVISIAAPIMSRYLTGMPPEAVLPSLFLQIACFVVAVRILRTFPWVVVIPVAYFASLMSAAILSRVVGVTIDVAATIQVGWLGIVVLTALGLVADRLLRSTAH